MHDEPTNPHAPEKGNPEAEPDEPRQDTERGKGSGRKTETQRRPEDQRQRPDPKQVTDPD